MSDSLLNPSNEKEVLRFKRHPFGIWLLYVSYVFGFIAVFLIIQLALPGLEINITTEQKAMIYAGVAAGAVLGFLLMVVARYIYWCSEMVVTESGVSEIVQYGLFNKQIARLDMEKIEDVTAQQKGIMATMFNFGTLLIETAGEVENFVFIYCPNPNEAAQLIHTTRQNYLERRMRETAEMHASTMTQQYGPVVAQQVPAYPANAANNVPVYSQPQAEVEAQNAINQPSYPAQQPVEYNGPVDPIPPSQPNLN